MQFSIGRDIKTAPAKENDGTIGRTSALCFGCRSSVALDYIRAEGRSGRMGAQLIATVAQGDRTRIYLRPTPTHEAAAAVERPSDAPDGDIATNPRWFSTPAFGMTRFSDLFTARQLVALNTLSNLVTETREKALDDAKAAGMALGDRLEDGGAGAIAYADAITTYLGMAVSKTADYSCSLAVWDPLNDRPKNLFAAQAIPMVWDFPEQNPFTDIGGSFHASLRIISEAFEALGNGPEATVAQRDAIDAVAAQDLITTDPPTTTISATQIYPTSSTCGCDVPSGKSIPIYSARCWCQKPRNSSLTRTVITAKKERVNSSRTDFARYSNALASLHCQTFRLWSITHSSRLRQLKLVEPLLVGKHC